MTNLRRVPRDVYPSQWIYHMASALVSLGRFEDASREIEAALLANAVDQGGVIDAVRALLRAKTGDRKGAEADVRAAVTLGKGFGHFHHTAASLGEVYSILGDLVPCPGMDRERRQRRLSLLHVLRDRSATSSASRTSERFRTFLTKFADRNGRRSGRRQMSGVTCVRTCVGHLAKHGPLRYHLRHAQLHLVRPDGRRAGRRRDERHG